MGNLSVKEMVANFNAQEKRVKEIDEMFELVAEAAMEQEMIRAQERGCVVFAGFEEDMIH